MNCYEELYQCPIGLPQREVRKITLGLGEPIEVVCDPSGAIVLDLLATPHSDTAYIFSYEYDGNNALKCWEASSNSKCKEFHDSYLGTLTDVGSKGGVGKQVPFVATKECEFYYTFEYSLNGVKVTDYEFLKALGKQAQAKKNFDVAVVNCDA